jgi:hypothetical protein
MSTQKTHTPIFESKFFKWSEKPIGKIILHVAFWLLFSMYLIADGYTTGVDLSCPRCFIIDNTSYLFTTMFGVYVNAYYLVPKFLYNRKIISYIITFFFLIIFSASIKTFFFNTVLAAGDIEVLGVWNTTFIWFFKDIFEVFAISSIKIALDRIITGTKLKDKEIKELEAEFKYLKVQVNPHFIFNTLNNIYFLTSKNSSKAGEAIISLSNILRYRIYERTEADSTIDNEIECIKELIELEKLRNDEALKIEFNVDGDNKFQKIEPLLFIPFIENAFKHCKIVGDEKYIKINFLLSKNSISFNCINSSLPNKVEKDLTSSGIGIKNVEGRLNLIYPNKYQLNITETASTYQANLKLSL